MKKGLTAGGGLVLGMLFGIIFDQLALGMIFGFLIGAAAATRRERDAKSN
jgi:F0F1-type ATP synthase assembly protein I